MHNDDETVATSMQEHKRPSVVAELAQIIARHWLLVAAVFALVVVAGWVWLARQTPTYEIVAVISEKHDNLISPTSGLSSLTGDLLGLQKSSSGVKALQEALYSAEVAARLDRHYSISQEIFEDRWDPARKQWRAPTGVIPVVSTFIKSLFGVRTDSQVNIVDIQTYLQKINFVKSDIAADTYMVKFFFKSPERGTLLLNHAMAEADELVRQQRNIQNSARLAYLYERLGGAQLPEQRVAISNLIQRLETQNVVISADKTYNFDMISPPRSSIQIARPRYVVDLAVITLAATILSFGTVWSVATVRRG